MDLNGGLEEISRWFGMSGIGRTANFTALNDGGILRQESWMGDIPNTSSMEDKLADFST